MFKKRMLDAETFMLFIAFCFIISPLIFIDVYNNRSINVGDCFKESVGNSGTIYYRIIEKYEHDTYKVNYVDFSGFIYKKGSEVMNLENSAKQVDCKLFDQAVEEFDKE